MALQGTRKYLGALYAKIDATIFNGRDSCLTNTGKFGQLILT